MPQDNTEVKQNQAVVLDVPLTYNDTLGWYATLAIGPSSSEFTRQFRLLVGTQDISSIIKSSEQPFSEQMNPQTGTKDPIFDFDRKELYNANVSVEPFGIQPTYGNSQRSFETLIYDDISQREKRNCVSTNITSGGAPFLIRHPICLLTHQFYEDTLDGRLSISPQPATHVFQNWDLALHSKGDNSERKWLPAGFEPESKYWSDYGIFATTDGFFYAINWNIAARKIKISWRDFSKEYFLTHSDLLKSPLTSKKVIKDRDSLLELNTTYPDPGAVLDSATLWTRLHPWVVDRVYNRIPGVVKFNTTYYLPCDMPSYAIPKISFEIAQTRGAKGGRSTWCPVKKEGFIIKSYKHPESGLLCAGTIQNAYRDPSLREYPEISPDKVPLARVELGQWVFKSWYMVFKNKKNPKVKEGRRYVGIAQMA
ncbi:hypothetical protein TWF192_004341 [Orbilia oligospora]|uniref:Uncharacterized protein n=1 Tax=Orbilia oligospora TaxID=2813651 RepID=A0A6G1MCC5_ORBOL|nr:hypothetical protein TWF191_002777 [Orbilia oligospora]KAF3253056.1 hypothetical protein TWF192_004341 [Orbilia oligospora]